MSRFYDLITLSVGGSEELPLCELNTTGCESHLCHIIAGSVQFSRSVVSDSLQPHESQHARPPCPSPTLTKSLLLFSKPQFFSSVTLDDKNLYHVDCGKDDNRLKNAADVD